MSSSQKNQASTNSQGIRIKGPIRINKQMAIAKVRKIAIN